MFFIIGWLIFGLLVGLIAKALHPGDKEPTGLLATVAIGIAGSYIGGVINWALGHGGPFSTSGFIMSILGAVICCFLYEQWMNRAPADGPTEPKE